MNMLNMKTYGSILTGREFGKDTMEKISSNIEYPVILDFAGVHSLGSSFADEVLLPIGKHQGGKLVVKNVKPAVLACIQDVAKDGGIEIKLEN